jgi:hypothetical protein
MRLSNLLWQLAPELWIRNAVADLRRRHLYQAITDTGRERRLRSD